MSEIVNRADRSEELFRMGYNCSQSVFAAFSDILGMSVEEAAKNASPFGAGFGKLREVCGAVSGMTMLAGHVKGYGDPQATTDKKALYELIQKMCGEFEERQKSIICRDMLGLKPGEDLAEPAVRTEEYYQSRPCVQACRDAAEIAEKYLFENYVDHFKLLVTYTFPGKKERDGFYDSVCANKISEICATEAGCIRYEYEVQENNDTVLLLHEEWENEASQKNHLNQGTIGFVKGFKLRFKAETTIERI